MKVTLNWEQSLNQYGERVMIFKGGQNVQPLDTLPLQYREKDTTMDVGMGGDIIISTPNNTYVLKEGTEYTVETAKKIRTAVRTAGKNLDKVNKNIKKLEKKWVGRTVQFVV